MQQKRIVIINQSKGGYLIRDIAMALKNSGCQIVFMTSHFKTGKPVDTEMINMVDDFLTVYDKSSTFRRLYTWLISSFQIFVRVWCKYRDSKLLIVSNPPFAPLLPAVMRNRFSLLIYDIYPDVLVSQHLFNENNWIVKLWGYMNKKVYAKANNVYTISDGMKSCLEKYVDADKIKVVPLWPDSGHVERVDLSSNKFIKNNKLEGKFIVLYSGNMGNTHRMDVLLDVAKVVDDDICFVLIGDGGKRKLIEQRVTDEHINNVLLLPFQSYDMLPHSLSAADIGVVTLDVASSQMSVPSKTYNLLNVGVPLMCIASPESELGNLVRRYDVGKLFLPEDIQGMALFVQELKNNTALLSQYRENSHKASESFTKENAKLFIE